MLLTTNDLVLRPIDKSDLDDIHSHTSDYRHVSKYFTTKIRSKQHWLERWERTGLWDDNYGMLAIVEKKTSTIFGVIWFFHSLPYAEGLEIGFNIFIQDKRAKGLVTKATKIFSAYLFDAYNINRIQCNTLVDRSSPGIESFASDTGFVYEGTMRKAMFIRGQLIDLQLFSLLRDECEPLDTILASYN